MTESKSEKLRKRLLDAAEKLINQQGVGGLRTRDVTKEAECALGSLYTVFQDLDLLILSVNSRTIARLRDALVAARDGAETPQEQLEALALAYVDFAIENTALWQALFDHTLPESTPLPDWHAAEHAELIGVLLEPLVQIYADLGEDMLPVRARTIFSAVHGIVALSLERRFVALPLETLRSEVVTFVRGLVAR